MAEEEKKNIYEGTNEDYYNSLKNESYKAMLSKEVQASVAADQARKYTQNALNAQGLGTQGIAQSTQLGIGNQYRNALLEAQNQHEQNLLGIANEQRATYQNDMNNLYAMADETTDQNTMDLYMKRMGYMNYDGSWKEGVPNEVRAEYDNWLNTKIGSGSVTDINNQIDLSKFANSRDFYAYDNHGQKMDTTTGRLQGEFKDLQKRIESKQITGDTYIELHSTYGGGRYAYLYYSTDGNVYMLTKEQYDNAIKAGKNKLTIKNKQ